MTRTETETLALDAAANLNESCDYTIRCAIKERYPTLDTHALDLITRIVCDIKGVPFTDRFNDDLDIPDGISLGGYGHVTVY